MTFIVSDKGTDTARAVFFKVISTVFVPNVVNKNGSLTMLPADTTALNKCLLEDPKLTAFVVMLKSVVFKSDSDVFDAKDFKIPLPVFLYAKMSPGCTLMSLVVRSRAK